MSTKIHFTLEQAPKA